MDWGRAWRCIPVVCAYNLLFDLQPVIYDLRQSYDMEASAQSSTHAYTVDLIEDGHAVLRFWDTYYLEMRGLAAMGSTAGLPKATGDWDYNLVRTPDTPLTDLERYYAGRDTEVIPAYLRYLLGANEWLKPSMLSSRVLTKTSLVRMAGKLETGRLRYARGDREPISVQRQFAALCADEFPQDYRTYAIRKACFRGGLTFTAGLYSGTVMPHVYSLDETSAHHAYINGHMCPVRFKWYPRDILQRYAERVISTPLADVLRHYEEPFGVAMHARFLVRGIRLRRGTPFERYGIATLARGKFSTTSAAGDWGGEPDVIADEAVKANGWRDTASEDAVFAFGKLYRASWAVLHMTEIELYITSMVYEFDSLQALDGECTCSFVKPPDYVTLLSNIFFKRKQAMKGILKRFREGEPFEGDIDPSIPEGITAQLRAGTMTLSDLNGYYVSTVKGSFNSIYGIQAQDVFKPTYTVSEDGELYVDRDTVATPENYADLAKGHAKSLVLYTYGMRIVGGSRLALVCAMRVLDDAMGERAIPLGGDTDSLKISCEPDIDGDALIASLKPFHTAVTASIDICMSRIRKRYPDYASGLDGVGTFEVEGDAYPLHMEAWNKARVSWDGEHAHVTCAGLPRPTGRYNAEKWIDDAVTVLGHPFERVAPLVMGWGVRVDFRICGALEHAKPPAADIIDAEVTDYLGDTSHVTCHPSIALYPSDRVLGDLDSRSNRECVDYLRAAGRDPDTRERYMTYRLDGDAPDDGRGTPDERGAHVPELYAIDDMGEWERLI